MNEYITGLKSFKGFAGDIVSHRTFDAQPAAWASPDTFSAFKKDLSYLLAGLGIKNLFTHQARVMGFILEGRHTVITTPTASGKSLVYNLPVMDALISDSSAHTLYLFPLKAFARDQLDTVNHILAGTDAVFSQLLFENKAPLTAGVYDGHITGYQRTKIRNHPPNILLSNPEMLHLAMLAHHHLWTSFFALTLNISWWMRCIPTGESWVQTWPGCSAGFCEYVDFTDLIPALLPG